MGHDRGYGRQSAPAILHGERSRVAEALGDRRAALAQRREDDRVFHRAPRAGRAAPSRATHVGVGLRRSRAQYNGVLGWVLLGEVGLGVVLVVASVMLAVVAGRGGSRSPRCRSSPRWHGGGWRPSCSC